MFEFIYISFMKYHYGLKDSPSTRCTQVLDLETDLNNDG